MKFIKTILNKVLFVSLIILISACRSDDGAVSCVPNAVVNRTVNLNLPLYANLNNPGGWIYLEGYSAGTRGLIIVNIGNGFKAYDRNAPHICPTAKSTLYVKDDIKIVCDEDESEWILISGQPIKTANRAPRSFKVISNGNQLIITN